jgi:hypothetical protein
LKSIYVATLAITFIMYDIQCRCGQNFKGTVNYTTCNFFISFEKISVFPCLSINCLVLYLQSNFMLSTISERWLEPNVSWTPILTVFGIEERLDFLAGRLLVLCLLLNVKDFVSTN